MNSSPVNSKTLRRLAWSHGFQGIGGLAKSIGRSRVTVWRAVRTPRKYKPTYQKLCEVLSA